MPVVIFGEERTSETKNQLFCVLEELKPGFLCGQSIAAAAEHLAPMEAGGVQRGRSQQVRDQ